jgi:hypothetical protein
MTKWAFSGSTLSWRVAAGLGHKIDTDPILSLGPVTSKVRSRTYSPIMLSIVRCDPMTSHTSLPPPATMPTTPRAAFPPNSLPGLLAAKSDMTRHDATNAVLKESQLAVREDERTARLTTCRT